MSYLFFGRRLNLSDSSFSSLRRPLLSYHSNDSIGTIGSINGSDFEQGGSDLEEGCSGHTAKCLPSLNNMRSLFCANLPDGPKLVKNGNDIINWASYLFMLVSMGGGSLKQGQAPERAVGVLGGAAALQGLRKVLKEVMAADDGSSWRAKVKEYFEGLGVTTHKIDAFLEWVAESLELHLSTINASIFMVLISDLPAQETEQAQVEIYKYEWCVALGSGVLVPLLHLLRNYLNKGAIEHYKGEIKKSRIMTTQMMKGLEQELGDLPSEYISRVTGELGGSIVDLLKDFVKSIGAALVPTQIAFAVFRDSNKRTLAGLERYSAAFVILGCLIASVCKHLIMKDGERHNGLSLFFLSFIGSLAMAEWLSEVIQQMLLPESEISLLPGKVCFSAFFCLYIASRMYVNSANQVVDESRLTVFKENFDNDIARILVNKVFVEAEGLEEGMRTKLLRAPLCPYEDTVNDDSSEIVVDISDDDSKSRVEIGLRSFLKNLKVGDMADADRVLLDELRTFKDPSLATFLEETGINLNASEDDESSSEDAAAAKALVELQTLAKEFVEMAISSAISRHKAAASTTPVAAAAAEHPTPNTQTNPSKIINL